MSGATLATSARLAIKVGGTFIKSGTMLLLDNGVSRDMVIDYGDYAIRATLDDIPDAQVRDVLALMGDSIDNIKGVPGIGEKGARDLIAAYGDLEVRVPVFESGDVKARTLVRVEEARESVRLIGEAVRRTPRATLRFPREVGWGNAMRYLLHRMPYANADRAGIGAVAPKGVAPDAQIVDIAHAWGRRTARARRSASLTASTDNLFWAGSLAAAVAIALLAAAIHKIRTISTCSASPSDSGHTERSSTRRPGLATFPSPSAASR